MPSYLALAGSWAKVMPPSALMAPMPSVPSEAAPDSTTPMARWPSVLASERKKESIGRGGRCERSRAVRRSRSPSSRRSLSGGMT